jgi:hypothetical protein
MARVTGPAMVDDRLAMPRKSSSAPPPASAMSPTVPPGRRNSPMTNSTSPATVTMAPPTSRRVRIATKPSSGRIAATGGMRDALREGMITEAIVMPTPTIHRR